MVEWKQVRNFKNIKNDMYEVSNDGDVRTVDEHRILHKKVAMKCRHPYYAVSLKNIYGSNVWILVHQLVATFFVEVPSKYDDMGIELVPDHLDNNGLNNHYTNLEWKTRGENVKSAHVNGFIDNALDKHSGAIVCNEQVESICRLLQEGKTYDEIIQIMGFPNTKSYRRLLVRIKNRNAWTRISMKYDFDSSKINRAISQQDTVNNLPLIKKLINEGKTNSEIIRIVWGNDCDKYNSKDITIRNIRNGKIYKDLL